MTGTASLRRQLLLGVAIAVLLTGAAAYQAKRPLLAYEVAAAAEARSPEVRVVVANAPGGSPADAEALARGVHERLDAMRRQLRIRTLPPVFLFPRRDLAPDAFEQGSVEDRDGIFVGVPATGCDEARLHGFLAWVVLEAHTRGRARLERRRWVLDGYAARAGETATGERRLLLRALHGTRGGIARDVLDRWLASSEERGYEISSAVAWSGLRAMRRAHGDAVTDAFLADALGAQPPDDVRGLAFESSNSIEALVRRHTGTSYEAFLREWDGQLAEERAELGAELARIPRVNADLRVERGSGIERTIAYAASLDPRPPDAAGVRFEWMRIGPFDEKVWERLLVQETSDLAGAEAGRQVPHSFRRGERIAWRVACRSDVLDCDVVSPLRRTVLE